MLWCLEVSSFVNELFDTFTTKYSIDVCAAQDKISKIANRLFHLEKGSQGCKQDLLDKLV